MHVLLHAESSDGSHLRDAFDTGQDQARPKESQDPSLAEQLVTEVPGYCNATLDGREF